MSITNVKGFKWTGSNDVHKYDYNELDNKPTVDATPTENSTNPVQSGGVFDKLAENAVTVSASGDTITISIGGS